MHAPISSPAPTASGAATFRLPQHVVHRTFVSETVVLNLATGKYYGVNPTGGRMLEVVDSGRTLDEAAEILAEEFTADVDQVRQDLTQFCADLVERGLLEMPGGAIG